MSLVDHVAEPSSWDSAVFGVQVSVLSLGDGEVPDPGVVRRVNPGCDVVFVKAHGWRDVPLGVVADDHLYDMEGEFLRAPGAAAPAQVDSTPQWVLDLACVAFSDSRFLRDSRLAHRAGEFYATWCRASAARKQLYILGGTLLALGSDADGAHRVELIATAEPCRSSGGGEALFRALVALCPGVWRVKVAARNWRAVRFYERLGFRVRAAATAWHVWAHE